MLKALQATVDIEQETFRNFANAQTTKRAQVFRFGGRGTNVFTKYFPLHCRLKHVALKKLLI
jgi:hypothetical protein